MATAHLLQPGLGWEVGGGGCQKLDPAYGSLPALTQGYRLKAGRGTGRGERGGLWTSCICMAASLSLHHSWFRCEPGVLRSRPTFLL